jgi:hypothetical protein
MRKVSWLRVGDGTRAWNGGRWLGTYVAVSYYSASLDTRDAARAVDICRRDQSHQSRLAIARFDGKTWLHRYTNSSREHGFDGSAGSVMPHDAIFIARASATPVSPL